MKTLKFQMRAAPEWLEKIDAWRRKRAVKERRDISRAEAIRMMVDKQLEQESHDRD